MISKMSYGWVDWFVLEVSGYLLHDNPKSNAQVSYGWTDWFVLDVGEYLLHDIQNQTHR